MNPAFLAPLLSSLTGGKVAADIFAFILNLLPVVAELVRELKGVQHKGSEKAEAVVQTVAEMIDDEFDDLPAWKELSEERRDRMLYGLVEWVYWGIELEEKHGKRGKRRLFAKALNKLQNRG